jgi:hypothetical protein
MPRLGLVLCALALSGCNSIMPGASAPEASVPASEATPSTEQMGVVVAAPLADLDCAPRREAITCN